jgi:gliding motility-associated-like protein
MNKSYLSILLIVLCYALNAQHRHSYTAKDLEGFDQKAAWKEAQLRSKKPAEQKEVFEALMRKYVQAKHKGAPVLGATQNFGYSFDPASNKTIINLTPQNAYCQNLDFSDMNWTNWTGGTYSNNAGSLWNTFTPTWTNGIVTMGNNNPPQSAVPWSAGTPKPNRHTIMTIPPTVNNPPANCIGWDSIAVSPLHVSDIPFVPAFASGVTCRLGNSNNDYETERLVYTMNVSTQNSQLTYYYAVVLYDGSHGVGEQPFFKVTMRDQAGNLIPGCGQYQIDAANVATDTSFHRASQWDSWSQTWTDGYTSGTTPNPNWWYYVYYKKWTTVGVDLSAYIGQNVTIEFQTGDCIYGGHWGYAYIDANCGPTQVPVNMCAGNTVQQLLGPPGYINYQWYGPNSSSTAIPAPNGTNDTLIVNNGNVGDTYYLTAISANGCTTYIQATLQFSSVSVQLTSSTPSCPGGNSGTASVVAIGSPGPYSYTWTNSGGSVVGNANPCTGLSPGTYSVSVSAPNCGQYDTTVTVGIAPPIMQTTTKSFCGTAAYLTVPASASGIQWYDPNGNPVPAPQGNNDTLLAANASNGQVYAVTYLNSGCYDSLRITLNSVSGGTLNHTNLQNTCIGQSNGQATVTLNTTQPAPYNYTMTGPGLNQTYTGVNQTTYNLTNLAYGTYTVNAFDGMCFYADVFKIDTIPIPVYLTVAPKSLCKNDSAYISYAFGGAPPTQCQVSSSGCSSSQSLFVGPANNTNTSFSYPTPFGNFYTKMRAQYIYTQAELAAAGISAGKINSITFNCTMINGVTGYPNFNISLGCTSQTTYSAFPTQNDLIPGLSNVYSSAMYNVVLGANTFNFSQAYEWDGVSNLVVEVCFEFPGQYNYVLNCEVDQTNTTSYSSLTIVSDTDPMCAGLLASGFYWPSSAQMRPTATFGWCSSVATPNMYTYNLSPMTGVIGSITPPNVTILQPQSTTTYTFTTTSTVGGCSKQDTFTINVIKPFNIAMPPATSFCTNNGAQNIQALFTDINTGAPVQQPAVWTGNGISNNNGFGSATFTPSAAGVGTHTLMLSAGGSCMIQDSVVFTVNMFQPATLNPIGPFCVYDPAVQIQAASPGGTWTGPVTGAGLFDPATAGVSSNLTPPYHFIKYVMNAGTPCPDSSSIQVQVFARPLVDFSTDTTEGCAPNVGIQFIPNVTPPGGIFQWSFGNGQSSASAGPNMVYVVPGVYSPGLIYTDPNGCKDNLTKTGLITVHPRPNAAFYANPGNTTILEPHVYFINTSSGASSYLWDIAGLLQTTAQNPDYEFGAPGLYQVSLWVTNNFGCTDSVIQFVDIDPDHVIYIPNAFSPNFDGKNDIFQAEAFGIYEKESFRMTVFDRWGNKMFEADDINKGWDGTKKGDVLLEDVFVYVVEYKDISGKKHTKTGSVSLIK